MDAIQDDLVNVASEAGDLWLTQIGMEKEGIFGQIHQRAVNYAETRAGKLISGVDEATRSEIATLITNGLEEGIGLDAIADNIENAYAFSSERAELIARTEIALANQRGVLDSMQEAKDTGLKVKKVWLPDDKACDICLENGGAGAIDLDAVFPSGDDAPVAHPNCRCTLGSEIEES